MRKVMGGICRQHCGQVDERSVDKQECFHHFVMFGATHLDVLCREYLEYYLTERPHQGRDNELLAGGRASRGH